MNFKEKEDKHIVIYFNQNMQTVSLHTIKDFIVRKKNTLVESCEDVQGPETEKGLHVWRTDFLSLPRFNLHFFLL